MDKILNEFNNYIIKLRLVNLRKEDKTPETDSRIKMMEKQIEDYENVRDGRIKFETSYTLKEIKELLPEIRISKKVSQEFLAWKCGIPLQKFLQYEDTGYHRARRSTILKVTGFLGVSVIK